MPRMSQPNVARRVRVAGALIATAGLVVLLAGCGGSPNAPTADAQRQWQQKPPSSPPPQALEAMRKAMQQAGAPQPNGQH